MSASEDLRRYQKQILFAGLGEAGQRKLLRARVAIVGCGALGSASAEALVRAGIGFVRLIDRDFVELSNLQRQSLYDQDDVAQRLPKAVAAAEKLRRINGGVMIESHPVDLASGNAVSLLGDVDLIMDGTDNFETRFLVNDVAVERNIPWVHGGCVGSRGQVMPILPGATPCLRCLMPEIPAPGTTETCDAAGVIGPAVQSVVALQVALALKILSGQPELIRPVLTTLDVWEGTQRVLELQSLLDDRTCACCAGDERLWLKGERGSQTVVLCGRNSVQVSPSERVDLNLEELAARLQGSGTVRRNAFLVMFLPHESLCELSIFSDGRAIISGTEDLAEAKSLYARFLGQ